MKIHIIKKKTKKKNREFLAPTMHRAHDISMRGTEVGGGVIRENLGSQQNKVLGYLLYLGSAIIK